MNVKISEPKLHLILLSIGLIVLVWSYIDHKFLFGWILLITPIIMVTALFMLTYKKFTFTTLVYVLGFLYACLLMVGAKYTYTYVPLFDYISDIFGWSRNYYDRVAHFAQGFVPFMVFREYLLRKGVLNNGRLNNLVLLALVLGFSATWELLEYTTAELSGMSQSFVLDMQGDVWDTQLDMLSALIGAITSSVLLGKFHLQQIMTKMNKK